MGPRKRCIVRGGVVGPGEAAAKVVGEAVASVGREVATAAVDYRVRAAIVVGWVVPREQDSLEGVGGSPAAVMVGKAGERSAEGWAAVKAGKVVRGVLVEPMELEFAAARVAAVAAAGRRADSGAATTAAAAREAALVADRAVAVKTGVTAAVVALLGATEEPAAPGA